MPAEAGAGDPVDPAPADPVDPDPAPADPVDRDPADPVAPAPDLGVEFNNSPVEVSFPTLDPLPTPQAVTVRRPTAATLPPESPELEPLCAVGTMTAEFFPTRSLSPASVVTIPPNTELRVSLQHFKENPNSSGNWGVVLNAQLMENLSLIHI